jgi:hypothetical protein
MRILAKLGAALVMGAIGAAIVGIGPAHACSYDCYDSGNTGVHCVYDGC